MTNSLLGRIKSLLGFSTVPQLSLEELQRLFTEKYCNFRELLTANNNALEAMAQMENALHDGRAFSMAFIRSNATVISVNIYKMIQCLVTMADGRYGMLEERFADIQQQLDNIINHDVIKVEGRWFLPLHEATRELVDLAGEKMANLGEAGSLAGIRIPPGFVVTGSATRYFFQQNNLYPAINRIFQQTDPSNMEDLHERSNEVQSLIKRAPLPIDLEKQLYNQFDQLVQKSKTPVKLAVRSSALGEDTRQASFAGLYHTELHVDRDDLIYSYKSVLSSTYSSRAMIYRLTKGFIHEETIMCVGCLAMIDAVMSGVCYSQSISGRPGAMDIFFSAGSAKGIVDGTKDTQHYLVERSAPYGTIHQTAESSPADARLMDEWARDIATAAMILENHFGTPQDIEWSINKEGLLYILQSRPISVAGKKERDQVGKRAVNEHCLLQGEVTGCAGTASGPVFVVRSNLDVLRIPKHSVLVVEHPLPQWAPLLRKATALVAETGSEAGHLATIAREFGVPAILSAKGATKLVNGQIVTIDATNQTIYKGRVEALLQHDQPKNNPMDGSPVQKAMIDALQLISPLHLTDPTSPYFRSSCCQSLHDITRFCHEKSVVEMFDFGKRYTFKKGAAKRLVDNMPLEWWVINLADGFIEGFDSGSNYINISEIISTPMLAIWEGMHAYGWAGPPQASVRGMGSLFFQSTRQPGIDPAVPSAMVQKNYFLVSRNYCNLSVRLGYHYAMVEAYISSLRTERYVTFRFKGGAADERKRVGRVELLAAVLEHYDFRIEKAGDALTARVEKRSQAFLFNRLKILGYLTIHTRQIDMVMDAPGQYKRYLDKFLLDIEEMIANEK
ncbi:PEP/pyruvate-binding domain-containing protein [Desulfogranum marinum]|uniref:PEP/pyruvate-binding domain-containing protein n=1 Tax=Desulfogranum marinum TaxID=453220 RepID=UPI0019627668|nr:PEP/pyruvate-binding domain-containing protein [Desulfogranum marinum]MBM9510956.1 hypothetical protein [Desulfogranum marinum]